MRPLDRVPPALTRSVIVTLCLSSVGACIEDAGGDGAEEATTVISDDESDPTEGTDAEGEPSTGSDGECWDQPVVCAELIECLAEVLPSVNVEDIAEGGSCWCGTEAQAIECLEFCEGQFAIAAAQYPEAEACGGDGGSETDTTGGETPSTSVVGATQLWASHTGMRPVDLEFSPDDALLARAGSDFFHGDFAVHASADGSIAAASIMTPQANPAVSWSPAGDRVATGPLTTNAGAQIFSSTGEALVTLPRCDAKDSSAIAWHPNQDRVLLGTDPDVPSSDLCLDDGQTGTQLDFWEVSDDSPVHELVWSDSGGRLAAFARCSVHVFDSDASEAINVAVLDPGIFCSWGRLAWRPGTQELVALTETGSGEVFAAFLDATSSIPAYAQADARDLAFSPDGSKLALISETGIVSIYDADNLDLQHQFAAHAGLTSSIAWSHDGAVLATGGEEPRVALWQLEYSE